MRKRNTKKDWEKRRGANTSKGGDTTRDKLGAKGIRAR
jgi:hypothetical protein